MKKYLYYLLGMNILVLGITCNTIRKEGYNEKNYNLFI